MPKSESSEPKNTGPDMHFNDSHPKKRREKKIFAFMYLNFVRDFVFWLNYCEIYIYCIKYKRFDPLYMALVPWLALTNRFPRSEI